MRPPSMRQEAQAARPGRPAHKEGREEGARRKSLLLVPSASAAHRVARLELHGGEHGGAERVRVLEQREQQRQLDVGEDALAAAQRRLGGLLLRRRGRGCAGGVS